MESSGLKDGITLVATMKKKIRERIRQWFCDICFLVVLDFLDQMLSRLSFWVFVEQEIDVKLDEHMKKMSV